MSSTHTETAPEPARTRFAKDQLKAFVERIERMEEEKKTIADDIRDIYAEAKGNGFDVKALRAIITLRKQDAQERSEHELILETYMNALGMLASTPLGKAATERAINAAGAKRPTGAKTTAVLAQAMADDGLITQEAATETARISKAVDHLSESALAKVAANPKVQRAFKKMGTPVPLTEEEKAKGYAAAFIGKDGTRCAIGLSPDRAKKWGLADDEGGEGGAPPADGSPPPQSAPVPAAAISRGGDGVAPTCLGRDGPERASLALAPEEAPGPRDIELNLSHVAIVESEAGGRTPTLAAMGPVLPPVTDDGEDGGIPPMLRIGHPACWRRDHTGPPGLRPP